MVFHRNTIASLAILGCLGAFTGCDMATSFSSNQDTQSSAEFQNALTQSDTVLVKFGAPWCGPCRMIDSELEQLEPNLPSGVELVKINVDDEAELASTFNVSSIPHMILFKGGKQIDSRVGYMSAQEIGQWISGAAGTEGSVQGNPFATSN